MAAHKGPASWGLEDMSLENFITIFLSRDSIIPLCVPYRLENAKLDRDLREQWDRMECWGEREGGRHPEIRRAANFDGVRGR